MVPSGHGGGTESHWFVHAPASTGAQIGSCSQTTLVGQYDGVHPATVPQSEGDPPGSPQIGCPPAQAQPGTSPQGTDGLGPHEASSGAQWWNCMSMQSAHPPVGSQLGQHASS